PEPPESTRTASSCGARPRAIARSAHPDVLERHGMGALDQRLACVSVRHGPSQSIRGPAAEIGCGVPCRAPVASVPHAAVHVDAAARSALWIALRLSYSALPGSVDG